uniref:NADH-ubiquinone oxidoreductase chain 6 n=1 Tax=Phasianella solida TaxID=335754 RepID=A0A0S1F5Q6_9VEST|nr:NADH dehydrogenase subunit 6 [Phasianella solida]ALK03397.1 NADH dehydrogenase subunit 6 [Phasianella solida]
MSLLLACSWWLSLVFILPMTTQPLSLGLCIMSLSISLCFLISFLATSWYAYILFLVYVGGLLVMFAYVSALIPNNMFSGHFFPIFMFLFIFFLGVFSTFYFMDFSSLSWQDLLASKKTRYHLGGFLMDPKTISITIILGLILLLNLIAVVKICNPSEKGSPLRPHKL